MDILPGARHHSSPYAYFTDEAALPAEQLTWLLGLFAQPRQWQHHRDAFYRAYLCDISAQLPASLRAGLVDRMRALTGLPLAPVVQSTIQRMEPGQYAGPHTDRPLVGYEAARLVVQLNPDWQPAHGGMLHIHPDPDGRQTVAQRPPRWNSALGFVMTPRSFHSVQAVHATRRTAVFNFWHVGNTPPMAAAVADGFRDLRFCFEDARDAAAARAEQERPEEDSHRAGCVAFLLQRWDASEETMLQGYTAALEPLHGDAPASLVTLARWAQRLWTEDFDIQMWTQLAPRMTPLKHPLRPLFFPETSAP
jgi:hypothetical protein